MYTAKIENRSGEILQLNGNESEFQVLSITGLNPPQAQINTTTVVGLDGAKFNSSKLETREIVIRMRLNGNVELNRQTLYRYFPTKMWVKFYFRNENRDVFIEGYVESVEVNLFSKSEIMQMAILCPQPYFKSLEEVIDSISKVTPVFYFPFAINIGEPEIISSLDLNQITDIVNASATETGLVIQISIFASMSKIKIQNTETGEAITLAHTFLPEDLVTINTNKGQKSVTLLRDGESSNLFSAVEKGSVFFQLMPGDNYFSYVVTGAQDSDVDIVFRHHTVYRGV